MEASAVVCWKISEDNTQNRARGAMRSAVGSLWLPCDMGVLYGIGVSISCLRCCTSFPYLDALLKYLHGDTSESRRSIQDDTWIMISVLCVSYHAEG